MVEKNNNLIIFYNIDNEHNSGFEQVAHTDKNVDTARVDDWLAADAVAQAVAARA